MARKGEFIVKKVYSAEEAMNSPTIAEGNQKALNEIWNYEGLRQKRKWIYVYKSNVSP